MGRPPSLRATESLPPNFHPGCARLCALTVIAGDHQTPSTSMQSSAACSRSPQHAADADPVKPAHLPSGEPPPALCLNLLLLYLRRAPLYPPARHLHLPLAPHVLLSHDAAELQETNDDVSTPRAPLAPFPVRRKQDLLWPNPSARLPFHHVAYSRWGSAGTVSGRSPTPLQAVHLSRHAPVPCSWPQHAWSTLAMHLSSESPARCRRLARACRCWPSVCCVHSLPRTQELKLTGKNNS